MVQRVPHLTAKLQGFGTTIFAEMSSLAVATGSVNLGQGFPDTDGPREVLDAAIEAINGGLNQYPPGPGMPVLREAISEHQQRFYELDYDPDTEVLVTAGAPRRWPSVLLGLCDTGDEVVVLEPTYDSYQACIALAGASPRFVTLRPPDYDLDLDALRDAITAKTKLMLLNTPHNPTGKVLTRAELSGRRGARRRARSDRRDATRSTSTSCSTGWSTSRWPRCPACASARSSSRCGGKTFNTTGWKVGLDLRPARARHGGAHRQAVPDLRQQRAVPARDRRGIAAPGRVLRGAGGRPGDASGTSSSPVCRTPASTRYKPAARTSSPSTSARCGPTATAWRSAASCRSGAASSPSPTWCSTTTSTKAGTWCGSRSASATR